MSEDKLEYVPLTNIRIHPRARPFSPEGLQEMVESMKTYRQLQPGRGRRMGDGTIQVYIGQRRFKAAEILHWECLQAIINERTDEEVDLEMMQENIKREGLDDVAKAREFDYMIKTYGWSQGKMAEKAGVSQQEISRSLAVLSLAPEVQEFTQRGVISETHGFHISKLSDQGLQRKIAAQVIDQHLTTDQTETVVNSYLADGGQADKEGEKPKARKTAPAIRNLAGDWSNMPEGVLAKVEKGWVTLRWLPDKYPNVKETLQILYQSAPENLILPPSRRKAKAKKKSETAVSAAPATEIQSGDYSSHGMKSQPTIL